jgi:hypothetical protein
LEALLASTKMPFAGLRVVWFFAKDKAGILISANPAFLKLCGISKLNDLLGKIDLDFLMGFLCRFERGGRCTVEV